MKRTLEIGGLVIPVQAAGDIEQTYESIGGVASGRKMNGAAWRQRHWRKLKTTVSGSGWTPPGLSGLDYDAPLVLKCISTRSRQAAGNVITVPAARRTEAGYEPRGYAIAGGLYVPTSIAVVDHVATLGVVSGAQGYGVSYWPQFSVYAEFSESNRAGGASWNWSIEAEEV